MADQASDLLPIEITDERSPLAREAVRLIRKSIGEVQPTADLLSELEERRLGLPSGGDYHLLGLQAPDGRLVAAASGVYLEAVNAGFVAYLAVHSDERGRQLGSELRGHLIEAFRAEARRARGTDLAWAVGEVRRENPWLRTLVEVGGVIPFDFSYFHPWLSRAEEGKYMLYREPVGDSRAEIPSAEVVQLLYLIWRRAYRIAFPLQSETFCYMMDQVHRRATVGPAAIPEIEES